MANLKTAAFMLIQAHMCFERAVEHMEDDEIGSSWALRVYVASCSICEVFDEIMNKLEEKEIMDKQINKVKKDIKTNNKKKAVKDVNKLLKMDKKFDARLDRCAKMSKKAKKK